jgi:hypothetical protein
MRSPRLRGGAYRLNAQLLRGSGLDYGSIDASARKARGKEKDPPESV